jgi:hypothetical protein
MPLLDIEALCRESIKIEKGMLTGTGHRHAGEQSRGVLPTGL